MANQEVTLIDSSINTGITITITIDNNGNNELIAFSYCLISITSLNEPTLNDFLEGRNTIMLSPVPSDFDSIGTPNFPSGLLTIPGLENARVGLNIIPPGETVGVRFTIDQITVSGIYDVIIRAGEFSALPNGVESQIVNFHDTLVINNAINVN